MKYIEKDLAPFIEERLQISFKELNKTKDYKNLRKTYNNLTIKLSSLLSNDIEIYEKTISTLRSMQSLELHRAYLLGFIDGIRLDEHLRHKKS